VLDQWPSESAAYFLHKYKDRVYPSADPTVWLGNKRGKCPLHHEICRLSGDLPPFLFPSDHVPDFGSIITEIVQHRITGAPEPDPEGNPFAVSDGGSIGYRAHFSSRFGFLVISSCYIYLPK
jgi:hypothetical protein